MDNNAKDINKYTQDIIKIVNEKDATTSQYKDLIGNNCNKKNYQPIYKVLLYSFKDGNYPYYVEDDKFENVFNLMGSLLVTIIDSNHVKEIKTGKIIPIVDLIKNNDYWTSSVISASHLTSDDTLFIVSQNKMLFSEQINIRDLNTYLCTDNKVIEEIFDVWQNYNKKNIKIKK